MEKPTEEIAALILRRRKQCLIHRYLYYVNSESLISDAEYDRLERELRQLVSEYPAIAATVAFDEDCPSRTVGSSNIWDYPRELQYVAESLAVYNPANIDWWAKVMAILEEKDEQPIEQIVVGQQSLFG